MGSLKLIFCAAGKEASPLQKVAGFFIRLLTWSQWSHVAVVDGDVVISAEFPRLKLMRLCELKRTHSTYAIVEFPCADPDAALAWAHSTVGLPYDWLALLGFIFRRDWHKPYKWFCVEHAITALEKGGSPVMRHDATWRITPQDGWLVSINVVEDSRCK